MDNMTIFKEKFAQFSTENNALLEEIKALADKPDTTTEEYNELRSKIYALNEKINKLVTSADWFIEKAIKEYGYCRFGNQYAIESVSEYRGFKYVIALMSMGHRCGYVAIPKDHVLYGRHFNNILLDCHGGLTYSDDGYPLDDGNWYIGFDCAHWGDGKDYDAIKKYFGSCPEVMESMMRLKELEKKFSPNAEVRSFDYVRNEIYGLINQLLDDDEPYWWEDDDDGKE